MGGPSPTRKSTQSKRRVGRILSLAGRFFRNCDDNSTAAGIDLGGLSAPCGAFPAGVIFPSSAGS
jgi:hypothetical protein